MLVPVIVNGDQVAQRRGLRQLSPDVVEIKSRRNNALGDPYPSGRGILQRQARRIPWDQTGLHLGQMVFL